MKMAKKTSKNYQQRQRRVAAEANDGSIGGEIEISGGVNNGVQSARIGEKEKRRKIGSSVIAAWRKSAGVAYGKNNQRHQWRRSNRRHGVSHQTLAKWRRREIMKGSMAGGVKSASAAWRKSALNGENGGENGGNMAMSCGVGGVWRLLGGIEKRGIEEMTQKYAKISKSAKMKSAA
jgi:hypothetical protein